MARVARTLLAKDRLKGVVCSQVARTCSYGGGSVRMVDVEHQIERADSPALRPDGPRVRLTD
jgi:hypothetical protein